MARQANKQTPGDHINSWRWATFSGDFDDVTDNNENKTSLPFSRRQTTSECLVSYARMTLTLTL